jgi:hypothetical protein
MNDKKNLEQFLTENMSVNKLNIEVPRLAKLMAARKQIAARKKPNAQSQDFIALIASFLNVKIKLYHAIVATIVICLCMLYVSRDDKNQKNQAQSSEYVSNIASVRSSTILSSIYTFGLTKKSYDGQSRN